MENNQNTTQTEGTTTQQTGEGTAAQAERTFTQEDVNRIVQERLAKERNRSGQSFEEREQDLIRRENRMTCAERLSEKKYPKELLDILDTSDADRFMENVEKLAGLGICSADMPPIPRVVSITRGLDQSLYDGNFRQAFGLNKKENNK
ncbi:MAG: hypothetical protein Q4F83_12520 [Eubacteriales bacterium]|nr:hypothetical protein [Eubacteriales bacterium]